MRVDLSPELFDSVGHVAEVAAAARPDAAIAVVVDAEGAGCRLCNDEYRRACARHCATAWPATRSSCSTSTSSTRSAAGGRWHCLDGSWGTVDDPSASPLAMAAVLDGRRLYARRDELQQVIEVTDAAASDALAGVIREPGRRRRSTPARDIEEAMAAAARAAAGESCRKP